MQESFIDDEALSLFALKSFWEGFDAPGDTLRCVVIPKLSFQGSIGPLADERRARDRRAFWRYNVPDAIVEVKQAAGRLIRRSSDSGFLVLADGRLQTKAYGRQFLRALPSRNIEVLPADEIVAEMEGARQS